MSSVLQQAVTLWSEARTLADQEMQLPKTRRDFWKFACVFLYAPAVVVLCMHYGTPGYFVRQVSALYPAIAEKPLLPLLGHVWWALTRLLTYFVLPAALIRWGWKESLSEYGVAWGDGRGFRALFLLVPLMAVALVLIGGGIPSFRQFYPMYRLAGRSWLDLLVWEAAYALQFFALEFLFRGLLIRVGLRYLGFLSVFAVAAPYCLIHLSKPLPEALGAVIFGVLFGVVAVRTGTVRFTLLLHVIVASGMDLSALWQRQAFPERFWPW